jgi:large subunit ribosomal protein L23
MSIIIKPIITEKMTKLGEKLNRYGFIVDKDANKVQIKKEIESMYGVNVVSVNTINYIGKIKMRNTKKGFSVGRANRHKKAIITLSENETIDFYNNI